MNTRDLEYLVAVAEELHFGRAAERCNASQPALSGQIRKLEEQLGVRLFERTQRKVRVTAVGAQIVDRARSVLAEVAALQQIASANENPFSGRCIIGMPPTIGPYLTPILLPSLRHYLPDLEVELVEDFTDNLEAQLADGEMDAAVLATTPARPSLTETVIYEEPFWVALPNGHRLTEQEMIDAEALDPGELLLLSDGHCLRDQIYAVCNLGRDRPEGASGPRTQKTSLGTILALVGAGQGITLVPAMSLAGGWVTDGGISVRREASGRAGRTVRLTWRKSYHRPALVERLSDIIAGIVPDTVRPVRKVA